MPDREPRRGRFEALFREHHPAVQAYVRRRVPGEVVDDVVSETFLVLWRRLDEVTEPPLPWLLTVARNVVGTHRRGAARRHRLWLKELSRQVEGHDSGACEVVDGRVLGALARLSERDREALALVAWEGLTPGQAAAVLGEPAGSFRQRLHRAAQRLRDQLTSEPGSEEPARLHHDYAPAGGPA